MTEREITRLRAQRGVPKGQVTNLEKWAKKDLVNASLGDVRARLERLETYINSFDKLQTELEMLDPEELGERDIFENTILNLKAKLLEKKIELEGSHISMEENRSAIHVDVSGYQDMPSVTLPTFDGDYLEWTSFINTFDTLVHNSTAKNMTPVKKFQLLKTALKDVALKTIEHLPVTENNYLVARNALEKRFCRKRLIFETLLKRLMDLPKVIDTKTLRLLSDHLNSTIKALDSIASAEQQGFGLLIMLTLSKLDKFTLQKWEELSSKSDELPTWEEFSKFLDDRCIAQECVDFAQGRVQLSTSTPVKDKSRKAYMAANNSALNEKCKYCNGKCPNLDLCRSFLDLPVNKRFTTVKSLNLCIACLKPGHRYKKCQEVCENCGKKHHKFLHFDNNTVNSSNGQPSIQNQVFNASVQGTLSDDSYSFLATAVLYVQTNDRSYISLRVLLDGGSQVNFISEKAAKLLQLPVIKTSVPIDGIHGDTLVLKRAIQTKLRPSRNNDIVPMDCVLVIVKNIPGLHPSVQIDEELLNVPKSLLLADAGFAQPQKVDLLLGADVTYRAQLDGKITLGENLPIIQNTVFGYVVAGAFKLNQHHPPSVTHSYFLTASLDNQLKQFWQLETVPIKVGRTLEEKSAEEHFIKNVSRTFNGRITVRLPFKENPSALGKSFDDAVAWLNNVLRRLDRSPELKQQYVDFIDEYVKLGHCEPVSSNLVNLDDLNYLVHFHVLKPDSTTTQLRVVFHGSHPTSSGKSLNDILLVGPTVQQDLVSILIRFRMHKFVLCGDISKMYRQILVHEKDRKFQCIVWKRSLNDPVQVYRLNTVTYGTSSAPFLATRSLNYLADVEVGFSLGSKLVKRDFYVDDFLTGADSENMILRIYEEVKQLLAKGQLPIKKWRSNSSSVLEEIPNSEHDSMVSFGDTEGTKTLGLIWIPKSDELRFMYTPNVKSKITKRTVVSEVAKIFDPLGIIAPVVCKGKIFIQHLWKLKLDWDEELPEKEKRQWIKFRTQLEEVAKIKVPRCVKKDSDIQEIQLHGFADASLEAYGACIYVRCHMKDDSVATRLLVSKTRVAPLKTISLPRLELCGALLLTELLELVRSSFGNLFEIVKTTLWLDSTVALSWIKGSPHDWVPFVANRVTKIQEVTEDCTWCHVRSEDNPADCASRGQLPEKLAENNLWFNGPKFLQFNDSQWNRVDLNKINDVPIPDKKESKFALTIVSDADLIEKFKYHNSLLKIQKVFGAVFKFIVKCRKKYSVVQQDVEESNLLWSSQDLENGTKLAVKIVQRVHFAEVISCLEDKGHLPLKHQLAQWAPFLDKDGIIRVGGRLCESNLTFEEKYPMLLPKGHVFSKAIFEDVHQRMHHIGINGLLAAVRRQFWPIGGKVLANQTVNKCVRCRKTKPQMINQIMGNLPKARVTKSCRCFEVTAVDFCGPFLVKNKGRGQRPSKVFVAIFICATVKAIHMEMVEDLSSEGFINALIKFISRRGAPDEIWSDNGTNFVGTCNELKAICGSNNNFGEVAEWCRNNHKITWKFAPPRSPHFNGLVESAVKLAKHHMKRMLGEAYLFQNEFSTLLASIEMILNLRPITPLSVNPIDDQPLTPWDFLTTSRACVLPEPNLLDAKMQTLKRWKLVVALKQQLWRRWSTEYLQSLQRRHKWTTASPDLKEGTVVLVVDRSLPSFKWQMGRIVQLFPGKDGHVRVILVKTKQGTYRRAITEVCPLPVEEC